MLNSSIASSIAPQQLRKPTVKQTNDFLSKVSTSSSEQLCHSAKRRGLVLWPANGSCMSSSKAVTWSSPRENISLHGCCSPWVVDYRWISFLLFAIRRKATVTADSPLVWQGQASCTDLVWERAEVYLGSSWAIGELADGFVCMRHLNRPTAENDLGGIYFSKRFEDIGQT